MKKFCESKEREKASKKWNKKLVSSLPKQADDVELGRNVLLGLGERHELELAERAVVLLSERGIRCERGLRVRG